jgi:hypothetical protein
MRALIIVGVWLLTSGAVSAAPQAQVTLGAADAGTSAAQSSRAGVRVAQDCGWFAILGCFRSRAEAGDWNGRIDDGYVVNTSSLRYPSFRPGYYCVVNGPTSNGRAQRIAAGWRRVIPDAYVKNSC